MSVCDRDDACVKRTNRTAVSSSVRARPCSPPAARHPPTTCGIRSISRYGADPEALNKYGSSPLHYAATLSIARMLIRNGARTTQKNDSGATPTE